MSKPARVLIHLWGPWSYELKPGGKFGTLYFGGIKVPGRVQWKGEIQAEWTAKRPKRLNSGWLELRIDLKGTKSDRPKPFVHCSAVRKIKGLPR